MPISKLIGNIVEDKLIIYQIVIFALFLSLIGCAANKDKITVYTPAVVTGEYLRNLAENRGFLIGTATWNDFWNIEKIYAETLEREFNILTPENQMKWQFIHPRRYFYDWNQSDQHVEFADAHNMKVHGHTLVWHAQNPSWLLNGSFNKVEMIEILRDHIYSVVGRYKGRIVLWDVVNEGIEGGSLRSTIWLNTIGPEYTDLAFQFAHEADPNATLIYNDFGISTVNSKSSSVYRLVKDMLGRKVPIHGVGFQMHIKVDEIDYQSFANNMQRFADLGLHIYVTELDVRIEDNSDYSLKRQALVYHNILKQCLSQSACKALQMWGSTDKYSWIPVFFRGYGWALPFDAYYNPKPAYYALKKALQRNMSRIPLRLLDE
jgi:endo-1,4-beta-xylanase